MICMQATQAEQHRWQGLPRAGSPDLLLAGASETDRGIWPGPSPPSSASQQCQPAGTTPCTQLRGSMSRSAAGVPGQLLQQRSWHHVLATPAPLPAGHSQEHSPMSLSGEVRSPLLQQRSLHHSRGAGSSAASPAGAPSHMKRHSSTSLSAEMAGSRMQQSGQHHGAPSPAVPVPGSEEGRSALAALLSDLVSAGGGSEAGLPSLQGLTGTAGTAADLKAVGVCDPKELLLARLAAAPAAALPDMQPSRSLDPGGHAAQVGLLSGGIRGTGRHPQQLLNVLPTLSYGPGEAQMVHCTDVGTCMTACCHDSDASKAGLEYGDERCMHFDGDGAKGPFLGD